MIYVLFDNEGKQINLADDERLIDESWTEVPENFEFDPYTERLLLIDGVLGKEPIPEYVAPPHYRINEYISIVTDLYQWPGDFPFDILPLHSKPFVNDKGLRVKTLHYADEDMTDAIVKVEYEFTLDEGKQSMARSVRKISYRMSDGAWSTRINSIPRRYSTGLEKQQELEARRNNVVDVLKGQAAQMSLLTKMNKLFEDYSSECYQYIKSGSPRLKDAIESDTQNAWLAGNLPNGKPARATIMTYLLVGLMPQN